MATRKSSPMPPVTVGRRCGTNARHHGKSSNWVDSTVASVGRVLVTLASGERFAWEDGSWCCRDNNGSIGRLYLSRQHVDDAIWRELRQHKIVSAVGSVDVTTETLKQIASLLGYVTE